jgi:hypothetical protein
MRIAIQAVCDECGTPHDFACFARPEIISQFSGVAGNVRLYFAGPVEERPRH